MTEDNTQKVRKGEELPIAALQQFLYKNELLTIENAPIQVTQFTHGYSNLTYLLETEN